MARTFQSQDCICQLSGPVGGWLQLAPPHTGMRPACGTVAVTGLASWRLLECVQPSLSFPGAASGLFPGEAPSADLSLALPWRPLALSARGRGLACWLTSSLRKRHQPLSSFLIFVQTQPFHRSHVFSACPHLKLWLPPPHAVLGLRERLGLVHTHPLPLPWPGLPACPAGDECKQGR